MRILKGDPSLSLDKIGLSEVNYNNILDAITAPQGMVLVTGPTGSGKTTTLYGCLPVSYTHLTLPTILLV